MSTSDASLPKPPPISLESLLDLNREIAALVRAGVPLDLGLRVAAEGLERSSSQLFRRLAERLAAGETLQSALAAERGELPRVYAAVVESGLRAGRLPQTLESLATLSESLLAVRRRMRLAFLYPALVVCLGYLLFVGFVARGVPILLELQETARVPLGPMARMMSTLHDTVGFWGPLIPAVVALLVIGLVIAQGISAKQSPTSGGWLLRLPGFSGIRTDLLRGQFCQTLSVLLENRTPLPEALRLASESLGDARIEREAGRLAERLERGEAVTEGWRTSPVFSRLLQWMMSSGAAAGELSDAMRRAGEMSLKRAWWRLEWLKRAFPALVLVVIGGSVAMVYGLAVFLPLSELIERLTFEPFQ